MLIYKKLKYIFGYLSKTTLLMIPCNILLFFVAMAFEVMSVAIFIPVMELLSANSSTEIGLFGSLLSKFNLSGDVGFILQILCMLFLFKAVCLSIIFSLQNYFIFRVNRELTEVTLNAFLHQEYKDYQLSNSSNKVQTIISEIEVFCGYVVNPIILILAEIFVVVGLVIFLVSMRPTEAIVIIVLMAIIFSIFIFLTKPVLLRLAAIRLKHSEARLKTLQEILAAIKEIIITQTEEYFYKKFKVSNRVSNHAARQSNLISNIARYWLELVFLLSILLSYHIGAYFTNTGNGFILSFGLIFIAFLRLGPSVSRLITGVQGLRFGVPSIDRLFGELSLSEFLDLKKFKNKDTPNQSKVSDIKTNESSNFKLKSLELQGLSFSFEDKVVFDKVSLKISMGEMLGIFGPSGSGKSTLIDVIMGLYKSNSGKIFLNGVEQNFPDTLPLGSFQYVSQDVYIIDDDIYANVAFGIDKSKINRDRVDTLLKQLSLPEFVQNDRGSHVRDLGENGKGISGGQRQRIGIARALYRDPTILFLDEPTSSLDKVSKASVMSALEGLKDKVFVIVVTHDSDLLSIFTKVYQMEFSR